MIPVPKDSNIIEVVDRIQTNQICESFKEQVQNAGGAVAQARERAAVRATAMQIAFERAKTLQVK